MISIAIDRSTLVPKELTLHFATGGGFGNGNGLWRINEVTLRGARLVLEYVTVIGRANHLGSWYVTSQPPRSTQLPVLSGTGNRYWRKCDDALRLAA